MKLHYIDEYLARPQHKVTVDLIGLGGTGSKVLTNLARMNEAMEATGHPGIHVRAWDHDIVSEANIGRQLFSRADLGTNKALVSITRINRFYGFEWEAMPLLYTGQDGSNIIITCVDSAAGRIQIWENIRHKELENVHPSNRMVYWLDMGNLEKTGQVILGSLKAVTQPKDIKNCVPWLPTVIDVFPQLKIIKEVDQGPSCSLAEAIGRQDLFINSTIAEYGCNLLWKLFRQGFIRFHGCYVNLESFIVNPIKIPDVKLERKRKTNHRKSAGGKQRQKRKGNKKSTKRSVPVRGKSKAPVQNMVRRNKGLKRKKKVRNKKQKGRS